MKLKESIKKILREEFDELNWIREIPDNPWLMYDCIIFDIEPSREDVNKYIELALSTKIINNADSWEKDRQVDIDNIIRYKKRYGNSYLYISSNSGNLNYGDRNGLPHRSKNVLYSNLINHNLNESKDEFDWIREIKPEISFESVEEGKHYKVEVLEDLINAMNSCNIESSNQRYLASTMVKVVDKAYLSHDQIWCGSEIDDVEFLSLHLSFYGSDFSNFSYIGSFWVTDEMVKLSFLPDNLYESEGGFDDFNWIRDIEPLGVSGLLNKAFYFDPNGDNENKIYYYNKLADRLLDLGFKPVYGTRTRLNRNDSDIVGLYAYENWKNGLVFVHTTHESDTETLEDYKEHIKSFASGLESIDGGKNLEVFDGFSFVNQYL